jgi:outer membrane scaffolding protein for murein synthesis (MipA/OmpV family)
MRIVPAPFLLTLALIGAPPASAQQQRDEQAGPQDERQTPAEEVPASDLRYVVGVRAHWQPEYAGSRRYDVGYTPIWAISWGRWHISTSGGTALLGFGAEVRGDGASTDLIRDKKWRVGLSLRIDSGRNSDDAETTAGLDDIKRTLRGRLYASYALTPDWQLSGALSQDLLGNKGGMVGGVDVGWRLRQSARSELTAGVGLTVGDSTYMRSYFGVSPQGSANSGHPVFQPGAGARDIHAGVGWTRSITPRWIFFTGLGGNYLLGPAADSPLTEQRFGGQFSVGLAYRN